VHRFFLFILAVLFGFKAESQAVTPVSDAKPIHEAFVMPVRDALPPLVIARAPPSSQQEQIPPQPISDAIWISGYWSWNENNGDFVWVCGVWRRPPADHQWIPGNWVQYQGAWTRESGFWSATPLENLVYIAKAPPASIADTIPASPGNNYFWIRGYWDYAQNNYQWLSGKWELSNPDWVMTPAQYIWRASGYVFIPMYWDFALDLRGKAYSCDSPGTSLVAIEPAVIVTQLYSWYPDYSDLFWHWNYVHPGFWDDCGCAPSWWLWNPWWTFPWGDSWALWWWWGHPGFLPPWWLSLELSQMIGPPPHDVVEILGAVRQPPFHVRPGDRPLRPRGPARGNEAPLPRIPSDVKPGGQARPPGTPPGRGGRGENRPSVPPERRPETPPGRGGRDVEQPSAPIDRRPVTPPGRGEPGVVRPPVAPPRPITPPQGSGLPSRDRGQPDYIPPRDRGQPDYIPPRDVRPDYFPPRDRPDYVPPRDRRPPDISREPPGRGPNYPSYTPPPPSRGQSPNITPPSNRGQSPNITPPPSRGQSPNISPPPASRGASPSFTPPPSRGQAPNISPPPSSRGAPPNNPGRNRPELSPRQSDDDRGRGRGKM